MEDVVSLFFQLFSHKYGCEGKPGFNPEAALVEARMDKPCNMTGFSQWAAQFGFKINKIMFVAEGSTHSSVNCSGYINPNASFSKTISLQDRFN